MDRSIPRMPREDEPIPARLGLRCTSCGYELTGLVERRCPECGEAFDPRETWLENERSTWEYHFENVRSKWEYIALGYVAAAGLAWAVISCVNFTAFLSLPVAVLAELYLRWKGGSHAKARIIYASAWLAWSVFVLL